MTDPLKALRPKPLWRDGAPSERGIYWVVFRSEPVVELVTLAPAYIHRNNPEAPLLMSWGSGLSYRLAGNEQMFSKHAIAWPPEHPDAPKTRRKP